MGQDAFLVLEGVAALGWGTVVGVSFNLSTFKGGWLLMGNNRLYIFSMEPPSGTQYVGVMPSVLQYI